MDTGRLKLVPSQAFDDHTAVDIEGLEADDVVIAVMGPTGSGKSTFIRRASGQDGTLRVSHGLNSFTTDVLAFKFWDQESGRHVVLVDTPSFDDTSMNELDVLNKISEWLIRSYKNKKLLSAILYLHRITDNRMSGTLLKNLRVFQRLCGKDALNRVYLITTMWDEVDAGVGEKRLTELTQMFWKTMVSQGAQIARCRSDDDFPRNLIRCILDQEVICRAVLLQEEMVELKKKLKETEAGKELCPQLEQWVERQSILLRRIDEERKKASNSRAPQGLQTEYNELGLRILKGLRQMRRQKSSWSRWTAKGHRAFDPLHWEPEGDLPCDDSTTVNIEDLEADDAVIVVMGTTGSGKSTLIRRASGHDDDYGVGHGLNSLTSKVLAVRFWDQGSARHVVLVDTPGFSDASRSDLDILNMVSDWLNSSYREEKLLSGILYLHRITDNRMTGTLLKNLNMFQKLCGKDALDKVHFITTMWDEVDAGVGEKRLAELMQKYWKTMVRQGAQIARCRSDDGSPKKLIQQVLDQDNVRKAVMLREGIAELKKEIKETGTKQEMYSQLVALVEKQLALLQRIDEERKKASDSSALEELQAEYSELRELIDEKLCQAQQRK